MSVFLHLKIINSPLDFFEPLTMDGLSNANADNYSSAEVLHGIQKLITDSNKLIVYLELTNSDPGAITSITMKLLKKRENIDVFYSGNNEKLEPLLSKLDGRSIPKERIEQEVKSFIK